jgi:hypothetical protein
LVLFGFFSLILLDFLLLFGLFLFFYVNFIFCSFTNYKRFNLDKFQVLNKFDIFLNQRDCKVTQIFEFEHILNIEHILILNLSIFEIFQI